MNNNLPFESAADRMFDVLTGPAPKILLVVAILFAGVLYAMGSENGKRLLFALIPLPIMLAVVSMFRSVFIGDRPEKPVTITPEDNTPGVISQAFDWLVSHGVAVASVLAVGGVGAFFIGRSMARKAARLRVKMDVRDLLSVVEYADQLVEYWQHQADQQAKGVLIVDSERLVQDRLSTVESARTTLLQLLAVAHDGQPLSEDQRREFGKAHESLRRCAKDSNQTTVVREEAASAGQANNSVVIGQIGSGNTVTINQRQSELVPRRQVERSEQVPAQQTSSSSSLLDPLNPLSPISPFSVWGDSGHHARHDEPATQQRYEPPASDDRACRVDVDDSRSSWSNDSSSSSGCDNGGGSDYSPDP